MSFKAWPQRVLLVGHTFHFLAPPNSTTKSCYDNDLAHSWYSLLLVPSSYTPDLWAWTFPTKAIIYTKQTNNLPFLNSVILNPFRLFFGCSDTCLWDSFSSCRTSILYLFNCNFSFYFLYVFFLVLKKYMCMRESKTGMCVYVPAWVWV